MNKLVRVSILKSCDSTQIDTKSWIANNPNDFHWSVAKPSYPITVDISTPEQHLTTISFKKKISQNGLLTDSIYSNLLADLKGCLINTFENGSTSKPYRLRSICNNIIYLIISVNEHRSDYDLPPILSFSQITEVDMFDYIKSFDIGAETFFAVLDEILSLNQVDFPDFARHQMSYIVTSIRGVYEQRQTVYPRIQNRSSEANH